MRVRRKHFGRRILADSPRRLHRPCFRHRGTANTAASGSGTKAANSDESEKRFTNFKASSSALCYRNGVGTLVSTFRSAFANVTDRASSCVIREHLVIIWVSCPGHIAHSGRTIVKAHARVDRSVDAVAATTFEQRLTKLEAP